MCCVQMLAIDCHLHLTLPSQKVSAIQQVLVLSGVGSWKRHCWTLNSLAVWLPLLEYLTQQKKIPVLSTTAMFNPLTDLCECLFYMIGFVFLTYTDSIVFVFSGKKRINNYLENKTPPPCARFSIFWEISFCIFWATQNCFLVLFLWATHSSTACCLFSSMHKVCLPLSDVLIKKADGCVIFKILWFFLKKYLLLPTFPQKKCLTYLKLRLSQQTQQTRSNPLPKWSYAIEVEVTLW